MHSVKSSEDIISDVTSHISVLIIFSEISVLFFTSISSI